MKNCALYWFLFHTYNSDMFNAAFLIVIRLIRVCKRYIPTDVSFIGYHLMHLKTFICDATLVGNEHWRNGL
jgi:hypothetical protein